MKISARNVLRGTVTKIEIGAINAEVTIEVAPDVTVVSNITSESARNLGLERGSKAYAVIKASSVMLGID
jgi:molybdopterin-binding protein